MIEDTSKGPVYDKSPLPPAKPGGLAGERNPDLLIGTDADGRITYNSGAASGHTEVVLPALPGSPHSEERLLVKDFGVHVAGKIESALTQNPYLRSGSQLSPTATFRHYVGAAKGCQLLDDAAIQRMETLAKEFEEEPEQRGYFNEMLKGYLLSLTPRRR
jgi:hypothetical protein